MLQAILLGTCMILIPAYAAVRMAAERSDSNVDLLFISTLRPRSIISGKFCSALVLAMLVYSCCAPFMTFTYLLRGIDLPSIFLALGVDLFVALLATQFGLFLAAIPAARALKFFLFLIAFVFLCICYGYVCWCVAALIEYGGNSRGRLDFWVLMGLLALTDLAFTGLLFCSAVALISPLASNRALAGRLFLLAAWFALGACCAAAVLFLPVIGSDHTLMNAWTAFSMLLFSLQLLISINERDSWGTRVARAIPRWRLLRPVAFLFYSGAAGGVIYAVLGLGLTVLASWAFREQFPTFGSAEVSDSVREMYSALALFAYCYGLSAVVVRYYLLSDRISSSYTWVVALLLVGLGTSLPWIAFFLIHFNDLGSGQQVEWWGLTNPIVALAEIRWADRGHPGSWRSDFTLTCFFFLSGWAALVSLLALPWFLKQASRFRPPAAKSKPAAPVEEEIVLAEVVEAT